MTFVVPLYFRSRFSLCGLGSPKKYRENKEISRVSISFYPTCTYNIYVINMGLMEHVIKHALAVAPWFRTASAARSRSKSAFTHALSSASVVKFSPTILLNASRHEFSFAEIEPKSTWSWYICACKRAIGAVFASIYLKVTSYLGQYLIVLVGIDWILRSQRVHLDLQLLRFLL